MAKAKKSTLQNDVRDSAYKVWLAGLGALATAEEEGSRLFKNLVKKGEGLDKRAKKQVDKMQSSVEDRVESALASAESTFGKLGKGFDEKVADALGRLGVPSRMEIQKLTRRIEQLTKKVDELGPTRRTTRAKTAARRKKTASKTRTRTRKSA